METYNYITVLNSDKNRKKWEAIQWDDDLDSIKENTCYTAGESMDFRKDTEDEVVGKKTVVAVNIPEESRGTAIIIKFANPKTPD